MSAPDVSLRVFWPLDIPPVQRSGVIIGWKNQTLDVNIVAVLEDVTARSVENALQTRVLLRNSPNSLDHVFERCGNLKLQVIGIAYSQSVPESQRFLEPVIAETKTLLVFYKGNASTPSFHCPPSLAATMQVIMFRRPDPHRMQYMSLYPISLTLVDPSSTFLEPVASGLAADKETEEGTKRKHMLIRKLAMHTVIKQPKTAKELALGSIINQINCSLELSQLLQSNVGLIGLRRKRTLSVKELVVESASDFWDHAWYRAESAFRIYIWPTLYQGFLISLIACRALAEVFLLILGWRILPHSTALKDIFATAQQIDIRLQQFCHWPSQYATLSRRRSDWDSVTDDHAEYIRFYNSLWLVANDVIIGIAVGSYIVDNADYVANVVTSIVDSWFLLGLQRVISWLMDWPAGLKLNNELAAFLGDLFLWVIEYWAGCMQTIRPHLPRMIRIVGYSSFAGASMPISMSADLVSLFTLHIHSFYIASARIYNWQLTIIVSLFHLFRGKKRNVLRNRIDSCDYDLDQLLLGTILFTLLTFLLPTVAVFYATFAGARTGIILGKACLDLWLACLNHFPLFALMLRVKDAQRLPGGIRFELQDTRIKSWYSLWAASCGTCDDGTASIRLRSIPLSLGRTFQQYAQLAERIKGHYLSPRVLLCLLTGQFIPPIHRKSLYALQYGMLPDNRVGVLELWNLLSR